MMLLLIPVRTAYGEEGSQDVNYSVEAILPEENQNPDVTYFDLLAAPGEEMELQMLVHNYSDEPLEVDVAITDATTNSNGLIIYEEDEEIDPSLDNPLSELVELEEERVTVPAGESRPITAHLKLPEEEFEGVKLGGFRFQEVSENSQLSDDEGIQIKNEYAYVIGLQVRENDAQLSPELQLQSIEPDLYNHRTAIKVNLQNPTPTVIQNLDITAEIFESNSEEPLQVATQEDSSFAPNSNMNFYIDWENQPLEAGEYRLELQATNGEQVWEWNKTFSIQAESALSEMNESAVELDNSSNINQLLMYIIIGLAVIIVILLLRQFKTKQNTN